MTVHAKLLRGDHEFEVIGTYMPCRSSGADAAVEESWDLLDEAVGVSGDVLVGGDLNAEPPSWLDAHGKQRLNADRRLEEMLEEQGCCVLLRDLATYRAGTLLDNWIVRADTSTRFGAPLTLPGVCGKDHKIAVVSYYYGNGDLAHRTDRPMCTATRLMDKDDWKEFEERARDAVTAALRGLASAEDYGLEVTGKRALLELAQEILGERLQKWRGEWVARETLRGEHDARHPRGARARSGKHWHGGWQNGRGWNGTSRGGTARTPRSGANAGSWAR